MATRIQLRRDHSTDWTAANPVLAPGEFGVELDTLKFKVGNGSTPWNSLPYPTGGTGGGATNLAWQASTSTVTSSTGTGAVLTPATTTVAGLMSSTDKSKLNGIATGATNDAGRLAASGKGFVVHAANANVVRPTGYASIEWHGSVEPVNAIDGDTWVS